MKKSFDVLIVFVLVIARIRSDTLADLVLPDRHEDVRRLVEAWWPAWSLDLLAHPETDPVSMMLIAIAVGMLATYLIVDIFSGERQIRAYRLKLVLIYGLIALLVIGKTILLINLRQIRGPSSYAHDGGVIQTEVTINYFLQGLNPYVEDYVDTPMAEWGFAEYRTALYHYPYLPWTFVAATPFFLLSQGLIGWFDVRIVYLLTFVITLALVQALVRRPQEKLIALAVVGLNPIAALSLIFGENDPFVMAWILLGLWLLQTSLVRQENYRFWLGSAAFGLACATKPTAWFLVPFWLLYLLRDQWGDRLIPAASTWPAQFKIMLGRTWPLPIVTLAG